MKIEEIRELVTDDRRVLTEKEVSEATLFFMRDSDGADEFIGDFVLFSIKLGIDPDNPALEDIHLCTQKYIANITNKYELKKEHLPFLYLREVEYYTIVNSYSECVRCINKILEMDDIPDFCTGAALSKAVDIFMSCGLTNEADHYVESLMVFSNLCDLPDRNLLMIDCNLMQAYATMGKRREYESARRRISKYDMNRLDKDVVTLATLYVLGAEAIIDYSSEPSEVYIKQFTDLCEKGYFQSELTADYSEVMIPILRWVKDKISKDTLVAYTQTMINNSKSYSDKLDMYKVLVDDLGLEEAKYKQVYKDYYKTLREYYENEKETHRHEVLGEMMSLDVEKQYKEKALKDELTGLGNRAAYEAEVSSIISEIKDNLLPDNIIVFAADVNGLKSVNDTFGHQAGDDYIKGAADSLDKAIGNIGHIYRTGGDEFMAIVRAKELPFESILRVLKDACRNWTDNYENNLTIAIGYSSSYEKNNRMLAFDELVHLADEAMYKDKSRYYIETGKDRRVR